MRAHSAHAWVRSLSDEVQPQCVSAVCSVSRVRYSSSALSQQLGTKPRKTNVDEDSTRSDVSSPEARRGTVYVTPVVSFRGSASGSAVFYRSVAHATRAIRDETPRKLPKRNDFSYYVSKERARAALTWPSGQSGTSRRCAWMLPQGRRLCSGCRASRRKLTPMKTCVSSLLACVQCLDLPKGKFQNLSRPQPGFRFPSAILQLLKRTASRRHFCLSHPSLEI